MSDRLKLLSFDKLASLVFRLDVAESVEPLDEGRSNRPFTDGDDQISLIKCDFGRSWQESVR
jgi:hypothetical protein